MPSKLAGSQSVFFVYSSLSNEMTLLESLVFCCVVSRLGTILRGKHEYEKVEIMVAQLWSDLENDAIVNIKVSNCA